MTRDELLLACFGRNDQKPGQKIYEMHEDGGVVSHADLSYKRIVVGRTTITVAAISNVCTDPAYRGKGYAGSLIRRAHAEVKEHPMVGFAAVFARDTRLFERLGYRPAGIPALELAPQLLVMKMQEDAEFPPGRIDTQGQW